jgi:hypothetical protein
VSQEIVVGANGGQGVYGVNAAAPISAADGFVARLALFFPEATPVRIPVTVTGGEISGLGLNEKTVIEFGTPTEVLFASSLPLEFADQVRIRTADGSLETDVFVVAVQYHAGRTAVAARFMNNVPNWIVKV